MPNVPFELLADGEPRGEAHDEPRDDGLSLYYEDGEPKYWVRDEDGKRACGSKKQARSPEEGIWDRCTKPNIDSDNGRCRLHGGQTPKGVASPHYEGAGKSQYLPDQLGDRMDEFLKDPSIVSVREDLALANVRLTQLMQEVEVGANADRWLKIQEIMPDVIEAFEKGKTKDLRRLLKKLETLVNEGAESEERWEDISDWIDTRRTLSQTETKRLKQGTDTLTFEEVRQVLDIITHTVTSILDRYDLPREAYEDLNEAVRNVLDT
jgi:hypothetical protein